MGGRRCSPIHSILNIIARPVEKVKNGYVYIIRGCIVKLEGASGKIHMLFAGDVDNMSFESLISEADSEIPTVYNYIKIPHHGSTSGQKLIELLQMDGNVSEYASTSVYVQHHLPDKKVLAAYGNVVETLICTSDIINQKYGKGVVYLDFDLDTKTVKTQYYGTAAILDLGKLKKCCIYSNNSYSKEALSVVKEKIGYSPFRNL